MEKLKKDVQEKFSEIRNVLNMREKLLLRQADVILHQLGPVAVDAATASSHLGRDVKFLVEQDEELLAVIRNFGRFHMENMNLQDLQYCTYLKNEDYISPQLDHETMYKNIKQQQTSHHSKTEWANAPAPDDDQAHSEAICVDFSHNKSLIKHNTQHMNESIVNITLQEAKELIKRAKLKRDAPIPPLNLEELDDELESSIAEAVSSLGHDPTTTSLATNPNSDNEATAKSTKENKKIPTSRFKPKITINNCNGTINLRNISSLTINCATEDSITARIPCQMQQQQQQCNKSHNIDCSEHEVVSSSSTVQNEQHNNSNASQKFGEQNSNENSHTPTATSSSSTTTVTSNSASNNSSSLSSRSQSSKSQKSGIRKASQQNETTSQNCTTTSVAYPYGMVDFDDECDAMSQHAVCDFYNQLLNEIKKSLRNKQTIDNSRHFVSLDTKNECEANTESEPIHTATTTTSDLNSNMSSQYASTALTNASHQPGAGRRLVLKNFENLRIVLEANSSDEESADPKFHPVQIEQWLAEIISETDLEPMQNSDILEHSKIHSDKD